jgi:RNA polymerase sigma-70 factor (ECF subfamily)
MSSNLGFALLKREDSSDEQLLRAYAANGVLAARSFEILFDRYYNRVHAYLIVKGAAPDVAEDLVQEVFLRIVTAAPTFDQNRGSFRAWLFAIATNIFIDYLRQNGDRRPVPLEDCEAVLCYIPSQILQLDNFLRDMAPELREPLELLSLCGLTAPEIAQVLQLPEGTVYSRIHRARRKLRRKLDPSAKIKRIPKKTFPSPPKLATEPPPRGIQIAMSYEEDHRNE